jgi:hypothetical protein
MSSVRTVRPRPLGLDERIPVYWSGREAPAEVRAVDGGSLYRYLAADTPKSGKKRHRSDDYVAPREVRGGRGHRRACARAAAAAARPTACVGLRPPP